ncbi:MAG: ATP-binding protein [Gammaproteobacteria bacterium]|nr:MAG: ATP-binding protein [Gammaproteobacteria bacterium]
MFIERDITKQLIQAPAWIQILLGPRQCGKSTLFASLFSPQTPFKEITFDDLQLRQLANQDPALFLQQFDPPLLLDEVQYVPQLFPELKKKIDEIKRAAVFQPHSGEKPRVLFRLTGSNQILMDKSVKESLAGRASYYHLNTLTVHEILHALPETSIQDILFKGGWPELYTNPALFTTTYLNDYIRSYVEKDIVMSAGIQKITEFLTVLRLCAARTGQETDYTDIHKDSGVSSATVKEWIGFLERADLVYQLKPFFNNLNKRLIKRPKLYFLDTGLAARLQGWSEILPLLSSPQIGCLFETLVLAEIVKFIRNHGKDWKLFFWRTKDGQEIDIVLKTARGHLHAFEAKYAIHGVSKAISYPPAFQKEFSPNVPLVVVASGGQMLKLSSHCIVMPISALHDYLLSL